MPLPWFFIDSITAPDPPLRGASSPLADPLEAVPLLELRLLVTTPAPDRSILWVNTSLESLRNVWVRFRDASARVLVSDTPSRESSASVAVALAGRATVAAAVVVVAADPAPPPPPPPAPAVMACSSLRRDEEDDDEEEEDEEDEAMAAALTEDWLPAQP